MQFNYISKLLAISLALVSLYSCKEEEKPKQEPVVLTPKASFTNSTEPEEWGPLYNIKESSNAHSGKHVSVIDSANLYSLGLMKPVSAISKEKFDSVSYTYWIYLKNATASAKSVVSIDDIAGKNIFWAGNIINDKAKELNKWIEVKDGFKLPSSINPEHFIKLYIWNTSKEEILLDDFSVTFY